MQISMWKVSNSMPRNVIIFACPSIVLDANGTWNVWISSMEFTFECQILYSTSSTLAFGFENSSGEILLVLILTKYDEVTDKTLLAGLSSQ